RGGSGRPRSSPAGSGSAGLALHVLDTTVTVIIVGPPDPHTGDPSMSQPSINPVAKTLYLCDGHIGFPGQKTDLVGLFGAIRPAHYPHVQQHFVIFAQLISGLGQVPFYIDIRYAGTDHLSTAPFRVRCNSRIATSLCRWLARFRVACS